MLTFAELLQALFAHQICATEMNYSMNRESESMAYIGENVQGRMMSHAGVKVEVTFQMSLEAFNNPMKYIAGHEQADAIIAAIIKAAPNVGDTE